MNTLKRCHIDGSIECKTPSSLVNAFAAVLQMSVACNETLCFIEHECPDNLKGKKMKRFVIGAIVLLLAGCATTYTTDDFYKYKGTHENVAILPFSVTMASGNRGDGVTKADLDAEAKAQALNFQRAVYTQFLERVEKDEVTVKFQDIDDTNALLRRADGFDEQGRINLTKQEISELLGVDAVISASMTLSKPMGTGTAVVTTLLVGWGVTNEAKVNLTIHDGESGTLVWSYDHSASGGVISSPDQLAKSLMRNIASKFPYKKD